MGKKRGLGFLLYRGQNDGPPETFALLGGIRSNDLSINNAPIDATTKSSE